MKILKNKYLINIILYLKKRLLSNKKILKLNKINKNF